MGTKTIRTYNIAGVELEQAKVREGTKCKCCNMPIIGRLNYDYVKTNTKSCAVAYVCKECIKHRSYGSDIQNKALISGKLTTKNYRLAIEIEAMYKAGTNIVDTDAFLAANYGIQPSEDGTVDVEYHMTNRVNFHGLKDFMQGIAEKVILDAPNCGHHINISRTTWNANDMAYIRANKVDLFNNLLEIMASNRNMTIEIFGRDFGNWAKNNYWYEHGSWLNLDNRYHLEFRLPHYKNANQFFYCACLCRDWIDILDSFIKRDINSTQASDKMIKEFLKYGKGKATCQRPERNAIER